MQFSDFLSLVKVIRMLYGIRTAKDFFEQNLALFESVVDTDFTTLGINQKRKHGKTT